MPARRTTFDKLQRDRAKKARAAAKRERRQGGDVPSAQPEEELPPTVIEGEGELPPARLLELIEQIHRQFENKQIDYEEFEEKKAQLMARLTVD